jgi:hypothetical protein
MQTKVASHWTVKLSLKLSNPGNGMEYVDAVNLLKIQYLYRIKLLYRILSFHMKDIDWKQF